MKKIVFLDYSTFPETVKIPKLSFPHIFKQYAYTNTNEIVERCHDADGIITNKVNIRKTIIDQLPKLKIIAVTATGTDNIDKAYCEEKNIKVTNVTNYGTSSVAEHTLMLILNLFKQFISYHHDMLDKAWCGSKNFCYFKEPIKELSQSKIGIIGAGVLGQEVGRMTAALGMEVVYVGRKSSLDKKNPNNLNMTTLEDALKTCDIISIHCPLTDETRNMITLKELKLMKKNAFLVNTARGGIINEVDLKTALLEGIIAGAACDVLEKEPPPISHPLVEIAHLPNFILTPHIAWLGNHSLKNLLNLTIKNLEDFFAV